jgi:hypothetical protein
MSRYLNNDFLMSTNIHFTDNDVYYGNLYINMSYGIFKRRKWKLKYFEFNYNKNLIKLWNPNKLYKNPKIIDNLYKYTIEKSNNIFTDFNKNIKMYSLHFTYNKKYFIFSSSNIDNINYIYNSIIGFIKKY